MRDYLRRRANEIRVIDCSPDGHQPDVSTRIFQGVQQPVCIVLASRVRRDDDTPAVVRYRVLPKGRRQGKFDELARVTLDVNGRRRDVLVEPRWSLAFVLRDKLGGDSFQSVCELWTEKVSRTVLGGLDAIRSCKQKNGS